MFFDKEEWAIRGAGALERYGNIDNRVMVIDSLCDVYYGVFIVMPTGIFTIMKDSIKLPSDVCPVLYLEKVDSLWYFGIMDDSIDKYWDFWTYRSLPIWAEKRFAIPR